VLYIPSSSEENHSPNLNEHTRQLESDEQGNKTEAWNTYSNGTSDFIHQFNFCISQIEAGDSDPREINKLWTLSTNNNNNQQILYTEQVGSNNNEYNLARAIRSNDLYKLQVYNYLLTKIIDSGQMKGLDVDFNKLSLVKTDGYSDDLSD
jgi:hypothetical protein